MGWRDTDHPPLLDTHTHTHTHTHTPTSLGVGRGRGNESGRGISDPETVFAKIKGQEDRSDVPSPASGVFPSKPCHHPGATAGSADKAADERLFVSLRPGLRVTRPHKAIKQTSDVRTRREAMRQEGRRAREPKTITGRGTQQRGGPPLFLGTRNLVPRRARASRPPAPASPYRSQRTATRPWSGLRGVRRGPLTRSPLQLPRRQLEQARMRAQRGPWFCGEGTSSQTALGERAGRSPRGRRGGAPDQSPPRRPPPQPASSWAGPRALGATRGRGQHFFVSPAQWAWHCGGSHPDSGGGRFNKDIYFSDYSLVEEKAEQTIGYSLQNIIQCL